MCAGYLEQLQAGADGRVGGDALLEVVRGAFDGLVQQLHQSTAGTREYVTNKQLKVAPSQIFYILACRLLGDAVQVVCWVRAGPLSWCFSMKHKGLNLFRLWGLQLHLLATRGLSE